MEHADVMYTYVASSIVRLLAASVLDAVTSVRMDRRAWCGHRMSQSALKPVVKRLTIAPVPQLRAAALVPSRPVQTGAPVTTG